jgi:hypothetical protein
MVQTAGVIGSYPAHSPRLSFRLIQTKTAPQSEKLNLREEEQGQSCLHHPLRSRNQHQSCRRRSSDCLRPSALFQSPRPDCAPPSPVITESADTLVSYRRCFVFFGSQGGPLLESGWAGLGYPPNPQARLATVPRKSIRRSKKNKNF